jgi:L-ascorbate metabolism protein UlaG (beta-lactamase superfamily)
MTTMVRALAALWIGALMLAAPAAAATTGRCFAIAENLRGLDQVKVRYVALTADEVKITYVSHSTFLIESPGGIRVATDFTGWAGRGVVPDVVTMNHAHESHYTDNPDKRIAHVLRGWNPEGDNPVAHNLQVGDVVIRNVTTDIRIREGFVEKDGNSIFIFEVANLCIGHLGHLHHELTPAHRAVLGVLDIVMAAVDGSYTLRAESMAATLKLLRARLILPMHYFGPATLARFLGAMKGSFAVEISASNSITVSDRTLPSEPKILVLPGY